ncbi:S-layer homology domain-containing protein [Paenibacillus anaericanus]|uniref:S-layer homology domain-containing protein n=1 Tax=Paenibacillus anaericanus TaxID=170367 RepID=A0A433Y8T2_9BACL|nr:S-layer homology domain-containing protein [Paenibacillus anaericanus]
MQLINGYKDGTFRPNIPITRAEFAVILNRVFNISSSRSCLGRPYSQWIAA